MNRRSLLKTLAAASLATPFVRTQPARADKGTLVVVSWGGDYDTAMRQHVIAPFEAATGWTVKLDAPPEPAKVKAMVQSGSIAWDVIMTDIPAVMTMMKDDLLQPIDYTALDKDRVEKIPKELRRSHALGMRLYSFNIVYNTNTFSKAKHPHSWAEVWDGKAFPGPRTFNFGGGTTPQLEFALLADGVPLSQVYPIDIERAWKKYDQLRPLVSKWYVSHAQAVQLLSAGEAVVGVTIGPRVVTARRAGAPIDVDYNEGKLASDNWCLVKGSANAAIGHTFINFAIDPKAQAEIARKVPYGPSNTGAFEFLSPAEAADLNTAPDALKSQFWQSFDWWAQLTPDNKTFSEVQTARFAKWMVQG